MSSLTQEDALTLFSYDPDTGVLTRRFAAGRKSAGSAVGSRHVGGRGSVYLRTKVDEKAYPVHRLIWLYVYGAFPDGEVDHINGNGIDNRLCNLRVVSHAENNQNRRTPSRANTTGYLGVSFDSKAQRYLAQIGVNGKTRRLGLYDTPEAAHEAYLKAKRELHKYSTL